MLPAHKPMTMDHGMHASLTPSLPPCPPHWPGRLEDKSSLVRKEALRLLQALMINNPFGPRCATIFDGHVLAMSEQALAAACPSLGLWYGLSGRLQCPKAHREYEP